MAHCMFLSSRWLVTAVLQIQILRDFCWKQYQRYLSLQSKIVIVMCVHVQCKSFDLDSITKSAYTCQHTRDKTSACVAYYALLSPASFVLPSEGKKINSSIFKSIFAAFEAETKYLQCYICTASPSSVPLPDSDINTMKSWAYPWELTEFMDKRINRIGYSTWHMVNINTSLTQVDSEIRLWLHQIPFHLTLLD